MRELKASRTSAGDFILDQQQHLPPVRPTRRRRRRGRGSAAQCCEVNGFAAGAAAVGLYE